MTGAFQWYVVQSNPRKETFVHDRLAEFGREVFLPLIAEHGRGRRRAVAGPLFPGYLFAKLSQDDGDLPRVRWMHGVRQLLGDGERAHPLDESVVRMIRARCDRKGRVRLGVGLRRGDRVRIVNGPLAGLIGVLERTVSSPEQRVCVFLEMFHRPTRVEVAAQTLGESRGRDRPHDSSL